MRYYPLFYVHYSYLCLGIEYFSCQWFPDPKDTEGTLDTIATEMFCRIFDKFFDICNTRSVDEHIIKKKPNVKPFYEAGDERLEVVHIFSLV